MSRYTDLITSQHADKPKFTAMIDALCLPFGDLVNLYIGLPAEFDFSTAAGEQLDIVGQWIGETRYKTICANQYFTFDTLHGFDTSPFYEIGATTSIAVRLDDDQYRLMLAAKIINNHWDGTKETAYSIGKLIFPSIYTLFIIDNSGNNDSGENTITIGLYSSSSYPVDLPINNAYIYSLLMHGYLDIKPVGVAIKEYMFQAAVGKIAWLTWTNSIFDPGGTAPILKTFNLDNFFTFDRLGYGFGTYQFYVPSNNRNVLCQ